MVDSMLTQVRVEGVMVLVLVLVAVMGLTIQDRRRDAIANPKKDCFSFPVDNRSQSRYAGGVGRV